MSIGLRILSRDTAQYRVQDIVEIHRLFPYGENYVLMIQGIFGEDPIEYVQCHCSSMDTIFLQHPELTAIYQAYTAHVIQEKKQYQTKSLVRDSVFTRTCGNLYFHLVFLYFSKSCDTCLD